MDINTKIISLTIAALVFLVVVTLSRRGLIRPQGMLLWLVLIGFVISIPILEGFYKSISVKLIGFDDARHMVYLIILAFFIFYILYLTARISSINNQLLTIMREVTLLESQLEKRSKNEK